MRHYPVFLDLHNCAVLVLGEGEIATRKAEPLLRAGAVLRMAARFEEHLLDGCVLAIGADAPEADLQALSTAARARGVPVNIVDRPSLCSFIMPATIDRDPVTIAVSTAGAAPVLARLLRSKIEALIPPAFGRLAALAERCKDELRARLPDLALRRRMLERAFTGSVAEMVFTGQDALAERIFREEIDTAAQDAASRGGREGMVFLVGAGPGAADLLTLRAQRLLGEADVIVHDRLVSDAVLDMARRDAERIYVGKARANHCLKQEEINALLVRLAQDGRKIVRLKGGDPFVFGRGGEEAEALEAAGIAFEIVPGITAALACAAQARIPLTHREVARSLTLVTGHTKDGTVDVDFATLAKPGGTLAVYMGLVTLPKLRDGLMAHGLDPLTPAALIERGGTPQQRNLFGTLDELVARAEAWSTNGPILALIGPAVGRATTYAEAKPGAEAKSEKPKFSTTMTAETR